MGMALQRWAGLEAQGASFLPMLGFVTVKAALVAKFILLGNMFGLARHRPGDRIAGTMLRKGVALVVLLIVMTAIEEAVVAAIHGRPVANAIHDFGGREIGQKIAMLVTVILAVLPYAAVRTLQELMGKDAVKRFLLSRPD